MPGPRYIGPKTCWNWPCISEPSPPVYHYYFAFMGAAIAAGLAVHIAQLLLKRNLLPEWAASWVPIPAFMMAIVPLWKLLIHG